MVARIYDYLSYMLAYNFILANKSTLLLKDVLVETQAQIAALVLKSALSPLTCVAKVHFVAARH